MLSAFSCGVTVQEKHRRPQRWKIGVISHDFSQYNEPLGGCSLPGGGCKQRAGLEIHLQRGPGLAGPGQAIRLGLGERCLDFGVGAVSPGGPRLL